MSIADHVSDYLIGPNTLKRLAGIDITDIDILNNIDEVAFFENITDEMIAVEIITLGQHKYELAFEYMANSDDFTGTPIEEMAERVEEFLPLFDDVVPHVMVNAEDIVIVVDCDKVDTHAMEFASKLLTRLPSKEAGFYWDYRGDI